jgi:hypothetical protein
VTPVIAWLRRERNRAYIYRGLVSSAPILVSYGVISGNDAPLILAAAAAWLGVGLATANTTTTEEQ